MMKTIIIKVLRRIMINVNKNYNNIICVHVTLYVYVCVYVSAISKFQR